MFLPQTLEREEKKKKKKEREREREMGGAEDLQRKRENPSSSSANPPDEISLFLHQVLLRSSSSPSPSQQTHHTINNPSHSHFPSLFSLQDTTNINTPNPNNNNNNNNFNNSNNSMIDSSGGYMFSNVGVSGSNISSSSVGGASENEADEYDCESERDLEPLLEEVPLKANNNPSRNSSKRSRTAEVHNLSEKRRRSRINEKMKALQSLIPNSNKTDKASMLDEAIEYLKQLQLQVQMLSMRNGLSLHPMCLPGVLQPIQLPEMRIGFGDENGPMHINMANTLPTEQKPTAQAVYGSCSARASAAEPYMPNMSNIINPDNRYGLESSIQAHSGAFQLHSAPEDICGEDELPHHRSNTNCSNADGFGGPSKPSYSLGKTG